MGIAGFFLWLQRFYGAAIVEIDAPGKRRDPALASSTPAIQSEGHRNNRFPPRFQPRRVTSVDCDNLYLDMNGLIHPCCHDCSPRPEPENEDEMMTRIFEAVDKLVALVKPKKMLYMAIDGVAPRSKMNQQRARRFRSAAEREEANTIATRMADIVVDTHRLPRPQHKEKWDHNVITPATAFMDRVGLALEWYVLKRLNSGDPLWSDLTVVLSDAHVPGEGEHKIMQYIRAARLQPGYDPNTRHMIHGQDADLIMLGLATHELHFAVLRNALDENFQPTPDTFCVLDVTVFRQRLLNDFGDLEGADFERIIDDFVFIAFFIGNDFLPHMPLVDIKCKGLETMLDHYVKRFDDFKHLTDHGKINYDALRRFVEGFVATRINELLDLKQGVSRRIEMAEDRMIKKVQEDRDQISKALSSVKPNDPVAATNVSEQIFKLYVDIAKEQLRLVAGKFPASFAYGEGNYRDEYYRARFGWEYVDPQSGSETQKSRAQFEVGVRSCVHEYLKGMQWVLKYYTSGCPSWEWFYPYHYAPLLQDVAEYCREVDVSMTVGAPLHPVEQLLAVLPRESVHALPPELHTAVLDPKSVLAKFYPDDFAVDYTEAIHSWQGIIQLPFVNCRRLQKAVREVVSLREDEGWTLVFCAHQSKASKSIERLLGPVPRSETTSPEGNQPKLVQVSPKVVEIVPLAGKIGRFPQAAPHGISLSCPDEGVKMRDPSGIGAPIAVNTVVVYQCELPAFSVYHARLLRGARLERPPRPHDQGPRPPLSVQVRSRDDQSDELSHGPRRRQPGAS